MKKLALTLIVALGFGLFQTTNAQTISVGVKAEGNFSNFTLSDLDGVSSNMGAGASIGGFLNVQFHPNFALQPELFVHYKSSELEEPAFTNDYQYWGVELPIYAVGQMQLGNGKGYIGIGPYVGFGISAKFKAGDVDLYKKDSQTDKAAMNRFDFGGAAMIGYEFANKIQINASYKLGFIDILDAAKDQSSMFPQTINVGVGYRF